MSIPAALETVNSIQEICARSGKTLVTYISMGFGNPYNDPYDPDVVGKFVDILSTLKVSIISLADTIGISQPEQIRYLFTHLTRDFPSIEFGAHLHSQAASATDKIEAAFQSGCQRFDGAIHGWGGCPMAEDALVGNLATESILSFLEAHSVDAGLDKHELLAAMKLADEIFPS